ncbi:MAG TPA: glycosyltransferase [Geothrix sp.]|nr:glycosyltransferase [Geothrix sp.]
MIRTRVAFLIPSLIAHGAERQLCELVRGMDKSRFEVHVVVLYGPEAHGENHLWGEAEGIPDTTWHCLHKRRGGAGYLTALPRLLALLRRIQPDILHGYMDANLPALLLGRLLRRPVAWGIRRTSSDLSLLDGRSRWLLRISARLSRFTDLIIFNSEAGRAGHQAMGMRAPRVLVIPNGFDVTRFAPAPPSGLEQRRAWSVPAEEPLIGIVGRLEPVKDHPTFLRAAARIAADWPGARFVCVGSGPTGYSESLRRQAESLGLDDRVLWPGACTEMPAVYNALTVLALASTDEGFPNVLGEAMACGIPCVSTRAGDSERLVGDPEAVVDPGDDRALAAAISRLLGEPAASRAAKGMAQRARMCSEFSTEILVRRTEAALASLRRVPSTRPFPAGA